ncbi:MAG: hypothetical protein ACOCYP_06660 [Planctomycetota bacterium]
MRSKLPLICLAGVCVCHAGCMPLINMVRNPAATAKAAGDGMMRATFGGLADGELGALVTRQETIDEIDSIIAEHGESMNQASREELASLRDSIEQEQADERIDPEADPEAEPLGDRGLRPGMQVERRVDPGGSDPFDMRSDRERMRADADLGAPIAGIPERVNSNLRIRRPCTHRNRLRDREPWHFTVTNPSGYVREPEHQPLLRVKDGKIRMGGF